MMTALRALFEAQQVDGAVELLYDCELSIGAIAP
jgi:hypothetical protein